MKSPSLAGVSREATHRVPGRFAVGLVLASAALLVTYGVSERGDRGTSATAGVLVGVAVCVGLGRRSILAAVFCALVTLEFFVAPLLAQIGSIELRVPPETVYIWLLAVAAGAMMGGSRQSSTLQPAQWDHGPIRWFARGVVCLMGSQAYLVLSGDQGYTAQIQGAGAPPSFLGTLSNVAPVGVLAVCAMWQPGSMRRSAVGALVAGEIALLVATGFRGSAPVFVVAVLIVVAIAQRQHLRAVGRGKLAAVLVGVTIGIIGSFTVAAHLKTEAAVAQAGRTDINFVWTADSALPQLGQRLDLGPAFWQSSAYFSAVEPPDVFSWPNQLIALVPRIFWHDKPIMDWGRQVTFYIYGSSDRTSSTISTLGDVVANSGLYGVLIIGMIIGFGLNLIEHRVRASRAGPMGCVVLAFSVTALFQQEQPLGLIVASGLQALVVLFLVWRVAVFVAAHSSRRGVVRTRPAELEQAGPEQTGFLENAASPRIRC